MNDVSFSMINKKPIINIKEIEKNPLSTKLRAVKKKLIKWTQNLFEKFKYLLNREYGSEL